MIPQKGGGGGESWAPQDYSELCPCGSRGGTLIQTRGILEEGCYCFANLWSTKAILYGLDT